jgi:CYTH domain-containing protein
MSDNIKPTEIEKKFTIKFLPPEIEDCEYADIEQGYLNRTPVVRVRRWNDDFILTYKAKLDKGEGTIVNLEQEFPLTKESFEHLLVKCDGKIIKKRRYIIPLDDKFKGSFAGTGKQLKAELDVFKGDFEGLVFTEVEFESVEEAESFVKPAWFDEDVTDDFHYSNGYLSSADCQDSCQ